MFPLRILGFETKAGGSGSASRALLTASFNRPVLLGWRLLARTGFLVADCIRVALVELFYLPGNHVEAIRCSRASANGWPTGM